MYARNFGIGSIQVAIMRSSSSDWHSVLLVKLPDGRVVRKHQDHLRRWRSSNEVVRQADELSGYPCTGIIIL